MKGRDALIVETLLAARRYGLEEHVAASIQGPGERVSFSALSDRVLRSLALHATRRADELQASSEVVLAAGVSPLLASAGVQVLREIAALELRDMFAGQPPQDGAEVLALLDERMPRPDAGGPQ
jgi:3-hydroxyisobutyrate dehydrogenase